MGEERKENRKEEERKKKGEGNEEDRKGECKEKELKRKGKEQIRNNLQKALENLKFQLLTDDVLVSSQVQGLTGPPKWCLKPV